MTTRRRVHVAGWGAVSGFGLGRRALVDGVFAGERAVRPRERTAGFPAPTAVAAELPAAGLRQLDGQDLAFAVACHAAREALACSSAVDPRRLGLVFASTKAELNGLTDAGLGLGSPARLAYRVAGELGLAGVLASVSCACASGLMALALAARRIAGGEAERVLVVGADVLGPFILAGFGGLHALDPGACRPFDLRRRGISLGDGAGAILLSAHARDSIGCTLAGHGAANDACHVTGPDREGRGLALAAGRALRQAGCSTAGIDLIHVHGTGTVANDACEALGLCRLFHGATAPAFGTKAQTGHTLGAAGLLETGLAIEALRRGVAPANIGLEEPGVCPDLDLVREPRSLPRARRALKVSSGFGGILAALVIEA